MDLLCVFDLVCFLELCWLDCFDMVVLVLLVVVLYVFGVGLECWVFGLYIFGL